MKKILIIMIGMLSIAATLQTLRSMDSVPANRNLLNPALVDASYEVEGEVYTSTVTTRSPITVDPAQPYTLSLPESIGSDVSVTLTGNDGDAIYVDERLDEAGGVCSIPDANFIECTFEPTDEALKIEMHGGKALAMHLSAYEYENFQLEQGTSRTAYIPYEPLEDQAPEIAGDGRLFVDYTENVPLDAILAENIEVHDAIDGDIPTENLVIRSDGYTGHETTVGDYAVELEATDSAGNTAYFDLVVQVYDGLPPVIEGPKTMDVDVNDAPDIMSLIASHFTLSDGHDGVIETPTITADDYSEHRETTGERSVSFEVTDASGNTADHTVAINVNDTDAPHIHGDDTLTVQQSDMPTAASIFSMYDATDNHDRESDLDFSIDAGDYDETAPSGTYALTLQAMDRAGNTAEKTVEVTVEDDIAPELHGLSTRRIPYTETFDEAAYIASMTPSDNDDTTLSTDAITLKASDYAEGEVGTFTLTFEVADAAGNTTTHTLELDVYDDVPPEFELVASVRASTDNPLDENTIQSMMMRDETLKTFAPVSYEILENNYSENTEEEGEYLYTVEYSNAEGETTVRSLEIQVASIVEDDTPVPYGWIASLSGLMLIGIVVYKVRRR